MKLQPPTTVLSLLHSCVWTPSASPWQQLAGETLTGLLFTASSRLRSLRRKPSALPFPPGIELNLLRVIIPFSCREIRPNSALSTSCFFNLIRLNRFMQEGKKKNPTFDLRARVRRSSDSWDHVLVHFSPALAPILASPWLLTVNWTLNFTVPTLQDEHSPRGEFRLENLFLKECFVLQRLGCVGRSNNPRAGEKTICRPNVSAHLLPSVCFFFFFLRCSEVTGGKMSYK